MKKIFVIFLSIITLSSGMILGGCSMVNSHSEKEEMIQIAESKKMEKALENFDINDLTLAVLNLDLFFLRHHNVKDLVGHIDAVDALANRLSDFFFVAGISVNGIPLAAIIVSF